MLNFNPNADSESKTALRRNLRAVERHVNDDHYVRSLSPGATVLEGVATHGVVGRWGVVVLPAAADTAAIWAILRPSEWVTGKLKITLFFSSSGAGTNNFRVLIQATPAKSGSVTTATTLIANDVGLIAGPAVANTGMERTVYATSSMTQEFDMLSVRILRTGTNVADTNANPFNIYLVRLEFIPAMQEADIR